MSLEWLGPALTGYKHREEIKSLLAQGWSRVFGARTSIAFTGMEGVGKSVLLDYLSGKAFVEGYEPPMRSQRLEAGNIKGGGKRLLVSIIPGQSGAQPRLLALDKMFREKRTVEGVIHVVANGFASVRSEVAARHLIREQKLTTVVKYQKYQREGELEDFDETCQAIRAAHRKHHAPEWLVIAIDKVDLYQQDVMKAREYYSPDGDTPFGSRLRLLQNQVGSDFLGCHVVPVCSHLENFKWHRQEIQSQVTPEMRSGYLAQFVDEVANFCR